MNTEALHQAATALLGAANTIRNGDRIEHRVSLVLDALAMAVLELADAAPDFADLERAFDRLNLAHEILLNLAWRPGKKRGRVLVSWS